MTEAELQVQIADYLRLQYPEVLFHSDFGSGIKLTPGQAMKQKRQNGGRRAWPDIFIAKPKLKGRSPRFGLFIELKREGTRLKNRSGLWANEHIREQAHVLDQLRMLGYTTCFAVGFDDAKKIIDDYLAH